MAIYSQLAVLRKKLMSPPLLSANIFNILELGICVLRIVADVNNAINFRHETLFGFQVTEQTHNSKSIIFHFKAP